MSRQDDCNFSGCDEFVVLALFFYNTSLYCHNIATEVDLHLPRYVISPVLVQFQLNQASLLAADTRAVHRSAAFMRLDSTTNNLRLFFSRRGGGGT